MPAKPDDSALRHTPDSQSKVKEWAGLFTNTDPHDLPIGSSPDLMNAASTSKGELRARGGTLLVKFGRPPAKPRQPVTIRETASSGATFRVGVAPQSANRPVSVRSGATFSSSSSGVVQPDYLPPVVVPSSYVQIEEVMGVDVTKNGVPIDGITGLGNFFQALVDNPKYKGVPTTFYFPELDVVDTSAPNPVRKTYVSDKPVYIDSDYHCIRGAGAASLVRAVNRRHPPFVFGLRRTELGGQTVTLADRPDGYGKLDADMTGGPGNWRGYRTLGRTYALGQDSPLTSGIIRSGSHMDMYGTISAWTIDIAVDLPNGITDLGQDVSIVGLGTGANPHPWVMVRNSSGYITVYFRMSDAGDDYGASPLRYISFFPISVAAGMQRFRVWGEASSNTVGAFQNGVAITSFVNSGTGTMSGKTLAANEKEAGFKLGANDTELGGSIGDAMSVLPDYTVHGVRFSCVAKKTAPTSDRDAFGLDSTTVWTFKGDDGEIARHITFLCGTLTGIPSTVAFIIPFKGGIGGIVGNEIRDIHIEGGSAGVLIGECLDTKVRDCFIFNSFNSVSSLRTSNQYTLDIEDCHLFGWNGGFNLYQQICNITNCNISGGYFNAAIAVASNLNVDGFFVPSTSETTGVCILRLAPGTTGGRYKIIALNVDDENTTTLTDGVVKVDIMPYGPLTTLFARNCEAFALGNGSSFFNLRGPFPVSSTPNATGWYKGQCDIAGIAYSGTGTLAATWNAQWHGVINLQGNPVQNVNGSGTGVTVLT